MTTQLLSNNEEDGDRGQSEASEAAFTSDDATLLVPPEGQRNADLLDARSRYVQLLSVDSLALYVNGEKQPILIQQKGATILGRYKAVQEANAVDLSPYYAHLLGVSREHAAIMFANAWMLEDLNSSNGTWINEAKLAPNQPTPLQTGDLIRLGHLQLTVSF